MENPPKPLKFAPKIALAVCIGLLDDNYKKVAYHLNDKGEGENRVIQINFVNSMVSIPLAVLEIIFLYSQEICPFKSSFWSDI